MSAAKRPPAHNGALSIVSAVVSTASSTGFPATGTTDTTAPLTRIGTVTSFVRKQPLDITMMRPIAKYPSNRIAFTRGRRLLPCAAFVLLSVKSDAAASASPCRPTTDAVHARAASSPRVP